MYKRVFTKNDINLNYQDYNKLISGIETLKTIKAEDNLAILKKFNNYQNWQTLSTAYFPFIDNNNIKLKYLKNIFDANESFIDNDYCHKDINDNKDICKLNMNILYPYGKIVSKKIITPQFPTNIYLCRWCNNKSTPIELKPCDNCPEKKNDPCKKPSSKCNLCKNARELFI